MIFIMLLDTKNNILLVKINPEPVIAALLVPFELIETTLSPFLFS